MSGAQFAENGEWPETVSVPHYTSPLDQIELDTLMSFFNPAAVTLLNLADEFIRVKNVGR